MREGGRRLEGVVTSWKGVAYDIGKSIVRRGSRQW